MTRAHATLAMAAVTLGCAAAIAELRPTEAQPASLAAEIESETDHISALELGERLRRGDRNLLVLDLRTEREFQEFHIAGAKQAALRELAQEGLPQTSDIVLYSEGGGHAAQAWVLLRLRGYRRVYFLREGLYEWVSRVYEPRLASDATPEERAEFEKAAPLSRYFGGTPRSDVPRAEVPTGYWTGHTGGTTVVAHRRGC
ncbi:MAG TPA: rhodanese-like domain-containing protein [Bryobacteraceae bacterium]|nr:rhodanese-like domain-containing protein [Bryobacteraceae bacterium]